MRSPTPLSQPAIGGDFGIRPEWPSAPSSTISAVAPTSSRPHKAASAGTHSAGRERARPSSLCAATLTTPRGSQRSPDGLRLEVGGETVVAVLAADARGLEAPERRARIDGAPCVHV